MVNPSACACGKHDCTASTGLVCSFFGEWQLVSGSANGKASDCKNIRCFTLDDGEKTLASCQSKCENDGLCNLVNFCPRGAKCSVYGRCCLRQCEAEEYKLVTKWKGWDVSSLARQNASKCTLNGISSPSPSPRNYYGSRTDVVLIIIVAASIVGCICFTTCVFCMCCRNKAKKVKSTPQAQLVRITPATASSSSTATNRAPPTSSDATDADRLRLVFKLQIIDTQDRFKGFHELPLGNTSSVDLILKVREFFFNVLYPVPTRSCPGVFRFSNVFGVHHRCHALTRQPNITFFQ